jgi:hypothetical protein
MKKLCGFLCVFMSVLLISSSALAAGPIYSTIFKRDYGDSWVFNQPYVVLRCTPVGGGRTSATVENPNASGSGVYALNDYARDLGAQPIIEILTNYNVDFSSFTNMALSMCDDPK